MAWELLSNLYLNSQSYMLSNNKEWKGETWRIVTEPV